jgi:serine/threonine-protein kinase
LDPSISATLDAIVLHALAKQADARYQTAAEMRADVERAMAGMPIMATTSGATAVLPVYQDAPVEELVPLHAQEPVKKNTLKWIATGVATMAAAGLLFFAGSTLFGSGINKVTVPNLTTKTVAEATTSLENVQLVLGVETPKNDDNAPKGTIISQDPAAGELLEQGQKVNITVSNGKEQVAIPELVDLESTDAATTALETARLVLGRVTPRDSDKPEGTVIAQSPKAGETVDVGTKINIVVSSGNVPVPDLLGMDQIAATNALSKLGFLLAINPVAITDGTVPAGTVVRQDPSADSMVLKGSKITLTLSKLPDVTPTASPTASVTPTTSPTTKNP